jgi:hypothetical protein
VSRIWANGVDHDKRTIVPCTPNAQDEPRGGPEFESLHSGRDRPANAAAVDGRSAQIPVIRRRLGERVKSTLSAPSGLLLRTGGIRRIAVVRGTRPLRNRRWFNTPARQDASALSMSISTHSICAATKVTRTFPFADKSNSL